MSYPRRTLANTGFSASSKKIEKSFDDRHGMVQTVSAMRFLPTLDLWADDNAAALRAGTLKLQRGQWVYCGNDRPSRFIRATPSSIWAIHPQERQNKKFVAICDAFKRDAVNPFLSF